MISADELLDGKGAQTATPASPADAILDRSPTPKTEEPDHGEIRAPTTYEHVAEFFDKLTGHILDEGPKAAPVHEPGVQTEWSDLPHIIGSTGVAGLINPASLLTMGASRIPVMAPAIQKAFGAYMVAQMARSIPAAYGEVKDPNVSAAQKTADLGLLGIQGTLGGLGLTEGMLRNASAASRSLGQVQTIAPEAAKMVQEAPIEQAPSILSNAAQEAENPAEKVALMQAAEAVHEVSPKSTGPTVHDVAQMSPSEFFQYARNAPEGFTPDALKIGRDARANGADIANLKIQRDAAGDEYQVAKASGDLQSMSSLAAKKQFFSEAYQEATQTGVSAPQNMPLEVEKEPSISERPENLIGTENVAAEEPEKLISIKNASREEAAERLGDEVPQHGESTTDKAEQAKAFAKLKENPEVGTELINRLAKQRESGKPVTVSTEDVFLASHEMVRAENERAAAQDELETARAQNDLVGVQDAEQRVARARDNYTKVSNVVTQFGTEQAQAFRARAIMLREDYSLASMERQLAAESKDGKLTKGQQAEVADMSKRLRKTKGDIEENEQKQASPENQLKRAIKSKDRQIAELERQIRTREPFSKENKGAPTNDELAARQAKIDALKEEREYIRDTLQPKPEPEPKVLDEFKAREAALDRQIKALEEQIKNEAPFSKEKRPGVSNSSISAKQQTLDALKEQRGYLRERLQPRPEPKTAQEKALAGYKSRTARSTAEIEAKLKSGDLSSRPKLEPIEMDPEAERLQAAHERVKQEFQEAVMRKRLANRTDFQKLQDVAVKWRRGFALSGPITLAKLTAAAAWRAVVTPIEEATGAMIGRIPVVREIAKGAPVEANFNARALGKAYQEGWSKGLRDSWQTLKTGKSDLDVLFGKGKDQAIGESDVVDRSIVDYIQNVHGALKAPIKRFSYTLAMEKQFDWAIKNNVDAGNPLVQTAFSNRAYRKAQANIFLQDNVFNDMWKSALGTAEHSKTSPGVGKVVGTAARIAVPVTKVPTNMVGEGIEYTTGLATGSWKIAKAARAGFETLTPEQKDVIIRNLKKGTLGAGGLAMILGYFTAKDSPIKFGGFYQKGEKKKKNDVPFGSVRVFGEDVPAFLLDHPLFQTFQIGATTFNVAQSKLRKHDREAQGWLSGMGAAAMGLVDETPFGHEDVEMGEIIGGDPSERQYRWGEFVKGLVVPTAVDYAAKKLDEDKKGKTIPRKPTTVLQHVESGIPGLREKLPKRDINSSHRISQ